MSDLVNETIKLILSLSISGGLFALALFALKPFMCNRLSKSFQYYIWLVVLLRFILPFSLGINLMDFTVNTLKAPKTIEETAIPNDSPVNSANTRPDFDNNIVNNRRTNIVGQMKSMSIPMDIAKSFGIIKTFADNLLWIWLAGAIISAAFNILGYFRFIWYVHGSAYAIERLDGGVKIYKSCFAPAPMLVGAIMPRIYLPDMNYTDGQFHNILLHELTHQRRHDIWLKWFAALVVSAHWFNPIVYFMRREFNRACELSCDEAVIRNFDDAAKQSYGNTLISVVAKSRCPAGVMSTTMCEEKSKLKERLIAIMSYRKKTKISVVITVFLSVIITGSALALGAQATSFNPRKPSYYMVEFPYEKISDISARDIAALILNKINRPKAEIYVNTQYIRLNTDYTLDDFTSEVLISEYDKNGILVYNPYQILIFPNDGIMIINPKNFTVSVDGEYRYCTFESNWTALSLLPVDAISKTIMPDTQDFYLLQYTPQDWYENSSPEIRYIFYDKDGVIDDYSESPSVMFNFWPMYQNKDNPSSHTSLGTTLLYYYDYQIIDGEDVVSGNYSISLDDLHRLAAKGNDLLIEDFKEYEGKDVGSGLYIMHYTVEEGYSLMVASQGLTGRPFYTILSIPGIEESIDLRRDDIDEFIRRYRVSTN